MPIFDFRCPAGHVQKDVLVSFNGGDAPKFCTEPVPIGEGALGMLEGLVEGTLLAGTRFCNQPLTKEMGRASAFPGADGWRR